MQVQALNFQKILTESEPEEKNHLQIEKTINKTIYTLYYAWSIDLKKHLIIKKFPEKKKKLNAYYLRESRMGSYLQSNLISLLGVNPASKDHHVFSHSGSYISFEKPLYGDFYSLVINDILPNDEKLIRTFFHQFIAGLNHLHRNNIAHMDLRLENIYLDKNYLLKIGNFNYSYMEGDDIIDNPYNNYQAPEVKSRKCTNFKSADIYSAGFVLFIMKTRSFPYIMDELEESYWEILCNQNKESQEFKEIFLSMIQQDPNKRANINDIKQSAWYKGPVYSYEELVNVLGKFKQ